MKILRGSILFITFVIVLFFFISIGSSFAEDDIVAKESAALELSLETVSKMALENSLDIQIAKFDAYMNQTNMEKVNSIFDTFLGAGATYNNDRTKSPSVIFGEKTMTNAYSGNINKKLPIGTDLELSVQHNRIDTDSQFDYINPSHEPIAGISLKQPVGKNFFGFADRGAVKITKIDIENSNYTSLSSIERSLFNVQSAYWKLVLKNDEIIIKKDMLKQAQGLYEIYKKKFDIGMVERADLLAMEANVTTRESDVLIAYLEYDTAKNNLLFLLNESNLSVQLVTTDKLESQPEYADIARALNLAIENRRDYKQVKNSLKANDIYLSVKKNALWPEIDLLASFKRNGLSTDFGESWNQIIDKNNDEIFLGATFKIPLENNMAKAELEETKYRNQKLLLQLKQIERLMLREMNNEVEKINTIKNQIELFIGLVQLQKEKLTEEEKRLKFGRSSSDIIVRYSDDLLNARLLLARLYYQYRVSLIELDTLENTLLDKYWQGTL